MKRSCHTQTLPGCLIKETFPSSFQDLQKDLQKAQTEFLAGVHFLELAFDVHVGSPWRCTPQEMLSYCSKHHKNISCVVVSDLSRFARNVADQGASIAKLKKLGIKTISIDEPMVDDTAAAF